MRVLLVEDDPMIGEAIQGALKDASYAADWVKDGQTALTTLGCQHYDLVLLDLGAVVGDFLDKPLSAGGLALSRYSASAALLAFMLTAILLFRQRAARTAH